MVLAVDSEGRKTISHKEAFLPLLFNIYTNDIAVHPSSGSYLMSCQVSQKQSFEKVENNL